MFSNPPKYTFWVVLKATLHDGELVDVFKNGGVKKYVIHTALKSIDRYCSWEGGIYDTEQKPESIHDCLINHRWYKYFENGFTKDITEVKSEFSKYESPFISTSTHLLVIRWVCVEWNKRHSAQEKKMTKLEVSYINEEHYLDVNTRNNRYTTFYISHDCSK